MKVACIQPEIFENKSKCYSEIETLNVLRMFPTVSYAFQKDGFLYLEILRRTFKKKEGRHISLSKIWRNFTI